MNLKKNIVLKYFFVTVDYISIILLLLFFINSISPYASSKMGNSNTSTVYIIFTIMVISLFYLIIFRSNLLYKKETILSKSNHLKKLSKSILYEIVLFLAFAYLFSAVNFKDFSLMMVFYLIILLSIFYIIRIQGFRKLLLISDLDTYIQSNSLLMSKDENINFISRNNLYEGATTKGNTLDFISYDNWTPKTELDHSLILGDLDCIREVENEKGIIEIIIDYKKKNYDDLFRIVDRCHSVYDNVKISSSLLDIIHQKIPMNNNSDIQLINASNKYKRKSYLLVKRALDIIGSIALMILFIPVFIPISILSFLSFTGPVFFVQDRIGKKGRIFRFIKFRTMRPMVGEDIVRQQEMIEFINSNRKHCKIINQLRITPLGKILRKFSLDELPQLYNVLKGDMSLVGPRPCLLYEYEQFEPWQKKRAAVKPGCTGVWQIFGRKEVSFKESIILDLFYVYNTSLPFDLKLISLTLPIMILGKTGE